MTSFFENVFDKFDIDENRISPHKILANCIVNTAKYENPIDYFYPKHNFTRDSSKLGFLKKLSPKEFFKIQEQFHNNESLSMNLIQVSNK